MSDSTQYLRRQINLAGDVHSVVRTMKAVAASSVTQFENSVLALGDYYRAVELGLCAWIRNNKPVASGVIHDAPFRDGAITAVVFGSDQGLVGQFNDVVAEFAIRTLAPLAAGYRVWAVGERVRARLADAGQATQGLFAVPNSVEAIIPLVGQIQLTCELTPDEHRHAQLWVFHNRPVSGSSYEPVAQRLLPLDREWERDLAGMRWPSNNLPQVIGEGVDTAHALVREYLFISLFRACAESAASENASRLAAMQRADKNIDELLQQLHRDYHRFRQSSIDQELFDVLSGFEALRGSH